MFFLFVNQKNQKMQFRIIYYLFLLLFITACQQDSLTDTPLIVEDSLELEARNSFPEVLPLPDGFKPEGIVAGTGNDFYVGSLEGGAIYKGDFRTGSGEVWFIPDESQMAVGLDFDERTKYLFVSGGGMGSAYIIDTKTGAEVGNYKFGGFFVNDVIVTKDAAYFTDSFAPNIYKLPLGPDGSLPAPSAIETLPLGGDFAFTEGQFNANGIEATPDGSILIVVNSFEGTLYRVDPETGDAATIDLGGDSVASGDGILLLGKTLYVVQNFLNQIAEVRLSSDYSSGTLEDLLLDDDFKIPTTVTRKGGTLYAVNARFDVAPPQTSAEDITFDVVRVDK